VQGQAGRGQQLRGGRSWPLTRCSAAGTASGGKRRAVASGAGGRAGRAVGKALAQQLAAQLWQP